jgi:hypothetical protein
MTDTGNEAYHEGAANGNSSIVVLIKNFHFGLINNVFGARLRITTLRAATGLAIECLEYLTPRDGRPMPTDERANDLIHWQTTMVMRDIGAAAHRIRAGGSPWVSPGVVTLSDKQLGFSQGLLVRDPDGHVMQLVAP